MAKRFSAEELTDRWYDRRNVANLAGKFVTSVLLKQEATIFERFWTKEGDACLSFNDGSYCGSEEVQRYFRCVAEHTKKMSRMLQQMFPEQLGDLEDSELFGVGQLRGLPITTPVIEIAEDRRTAKGIWHIQGCDSGLTVYGPLSYWSLGFLAIDFRREEEEWRLWHVLHAEDIISPMGESWIDPRVREPLPEFAAAAEFDRPAYTVRRVNYVPYAPDRPFSPPPRVPEPYITFADTFSYGISDGEAV